MQNFLDADDLLGIWGQSMGAATVENTMDETIFNQYVDFTVLDSPLGNMEDALGARNFFDRSKLFFASIFSKSNLGFWYKDQCVFSQIKKTSIPVMVVSSTADESIPYFVQ